MLNRINVPAWLMAAAIFALVLMAMLNAKLIWDRKHTAHAWALDSTTYYKFLEGQGRMNLNLYVQQQAHEERLRKLDNKRLARFRQIDSLSGDALQHEIDRLYNGLPAPDGPKANSSNRNGSASGSERPGRPAHADGPSAKSGHLAEPATPGANPAGANDSAAKRTPATNDQLSRAASERTGHEIPETAGRAVGKLAGTAGSRGVHSRQAQTNLNYWRLIQAQGYTYPEVAWAISAVETGYWWTPPPGQNLFGFKKNGRGFYEAISAGGYCRYRSEFASLADYGAYEQQVIAKYGLHTKAQYLSHIHKRYCPNPAYRDKLVLAFQALSKTKALA